MPDFLLELFSEEIPARMQPAACAQLKSAFETLLKDNGLTAAHIETHATPRRLAVIARNLPAASEATSEERRGPKVDAPAQAIEGFLKSTGLTRDSLETRDTGKGVFLFAQIGKSGRATADILAEKLPALITGFQWPKSQRWGPASSSTASPRWVRPLREIVALLDDEVIEFEALGVQSGRTTFGHRFMGDGQPLCIDHVGSYVQQLQAAFVVLSADERRAYIREGAARLAMAEGLVVRPDEALEAENAGLTEWPVPLLGHFDPDYLSVPPEIIQLTMRTNQKYFALSSPPSGGSDSPKASGGGVNAADQLAPAFICIANLEAPDGGRTIIAGNERVLSARLADARFFWDQDRKIPLEKHAEKLKDIVFHEKLGTMADKVDRVAKLARWLIESGAIPPNLPTVIPANAGTQNAPQSTAGAASPPTLPVTPAKAGVSPPPASTTASGEMPAFAGMTASGGAPLTVAEAADLAERAARLAKADLTTGTVGEFPELQGIIGGYLAEAQGERLSVAAGLRQQYATAPEESVPVALALADRLDTLASFVVVGEMPTGSRDPFAVRRAGLGALNIIQANSIRISLIDLCVQSVGQVFLKQLGDVTRDQALSVVAAAKVIFPNFDGNAEILAELPKFHSLPSEQFAKILEILAAPSQLAVNFLIDRLKVQQREAGVRHDLIDAIFALGNEDDLVRVLARVHALQAFIETPDGITLLAGYKRATNILRIEEKKDGVTYAFDAAIPLSKYIGETEKNLAAFFVPAESSSSTAFFDEADALFGREDFEGAMKLLATLRAPVDAFFEQVTVNDPDPETRARRLGLLAAIRDAMHRVADFSKIEG